MKQVYRNPFAYKCMAVAIALTTAAPAMAQGTPFNDSNPQQYRLTARASELDSRAKAHPDIGFLIEDKKGKPQDVQNASVDTRVAPRGRLVIWMMSPSNALFDRLNSYGLHAIRVHYARHWFGIKCKEKPVGENCRGNIRLEAATGEDFSDDVDIPKPDSMMHRAYVFVKHLSQKNPQGKWEQFLNEDGSDLNWDKVIMSGASHGSTTSARFAKYKRVARVVALCGPRDQHQTWQGLPSATPENRFFGFSHVLDGGWTDDHYCRSWELLGMYKFGPIVNVDKVGPPFQNSRRLITDGDVGGDAGKAHGCVTPGSRSIKDKNGKLAHEAVWRYLYTHPVDKVGKPDKKDPNCKPTPQ